MQEYQLPLLGMTATEVVGGISGDSEANIRDLFEQAAVRIDANYLYPYHIFFHGNRSQLLAKE